MLKIHELMKRRVLVSRDSAEPIRNALRDSTLEEGQTLTLDFHGVEGITPSFIDEVFHHLRNELSTKGVHSTRIVFANVPTRLSSKFLAIGRAHDLALDETAPGLWTVVVRPTQEQH